MRERWMVGGRMMTGGFAWLRSRLILSHCSCPIDCGIPPQGSLYIAKRLGVHSGVKLCRARGVKTQRRGGIPTWPCKRILPMEKTGCKRGGACYTNCLRFQSWALPGCRQKQARHRLLPSSARSSREPRLMVKFNGRKSRLLFPLRDSDYFIFCTFVLYSPQIKENLGPEGAPSPIVRRSHMSFQFCQTWVKDLFS